MKIKIDTAYTTIDGKPIVKRAIELLKAVYTDREIIAKVEETFEENFGYFEVLRLDGQAFNTNAYDINLISISFTAIVYDICGAFFEVDFIIRMTDGSADFKIVDDCAPLYRCREYRRVIKA